MNAEALYPRHESTGNDIGMAEILRHHRDHYEELDRKGWMYKLPVQDSIRDLVGPSYLGSFYDAYGFNIDLNAFLIEGFKIYDKEGKPGALTGAIHPRVRMLRR